MFKSRAKGKAHDVSVPTTSGPLQSSILKTDDPPLMLRCLLQGQSTPFKVDIPASADINDVKKAIKAEKENDLKPYDADTLIVFKVSHSRSSSSFEADRLTLPHPSQVNIDLDAHTKDSLRRLDIKEDDVDVQELKEWKPVSYYWLTQAALERLHIFVRLPADGEWFHRSCLLTVLTVSSQ
jgi:hypothetical protein